MPSATGSVSRSEARSPLALAIDIGTSSTRVVAFDTIARPVHGAAVREAHAVATDAVGAATLDADRLLGGVTRCIDGVVAKLGRRAADVAVVGTSVFWHGLLGIDARAKPTTPLFTWADLRARDAARALASEIDPDAFHARTGCYLNSTYPAVKLRWLRDAEPATVRRTARWISFAEYLQLRLQGEAHASHGIASASGLYDHGPRAWDPLTLRAIDLDPRTLSPISDEATTGLRAVYAKRWPTLAQVPWVPGIGDGALANVGSGSATRDRAAISFGTSGAVRACYRGGRAHAPRGLWEYRLDDRYVVVGGAVNNGWNAIQWIQRTIAEATTTDGGHGLTVLPLFAGERTPWWDDRATGAITGLRLATRPAEIASALIESVVVRLAAAAEAVVDAQPAVARLIASGGVFAWRPEIAQMIADAIGRPVALAEDAEASARGAAIVALERIRALRSIEVAPRIARTFRPRPTRRAHYREVIERQERLHSALREAGL
jgi:gluconokinase